MPRRRAGLWNSLYFLTSFEATGAFERILGPSMTEMVVSRTANWCGLKSSRKYPPISAKLRKQSRSDAASANAVGPSIGSVRTSLPSVGNFVA